MYRCEWVKRVLKTHRDLIDQTTFGGLGPTRPRRIRNAKVNASQTAVKAQLIDCIVALAEKYVIIARLFGKRSVIRLMEKTTL